jgi:hypothetical protein
MALFFLVLLIWWAVSSAKERKKARREEALGYHPPPIWDARFATDAELKVAGAFKNKLGIGIGASRENGQEIFYNPGAGQFKPVIQFGGMGSGKTTCFHIPFALRWGIDK